MDNMWYFHTMKYYSAINRNEVVIYITTQINLETVLLNERTQPYIMLLCLKQENPYRQEADLYFSKTGVKRIRKMIPNIFLNVFFAGNRNVLKLDMDMVVFCILKFGEFLLCELYFSKTGGEEKERKKKGLDIFKYSQIMIQVVYMFVKPQNKRDVTRQYILHI